MQLLKPNVENNVKIALFMGMKTKYSYIHRAVVYEDGHSTYNEDELLYDKSFDWIMAVVQKIIYQHQHISNEFDEKIKQNPYDKKNIYICVLEFINSLK